MPHVIFIVSSVAASTAQYNSPAQFPNQKHYFCNRQHFEDHKKLRVFTSRIEIDEI